ncbi:MAG: hypothetical protein JXB42_10345 [Deltaproteobacteria bacterium]|nr:hypothetical protein [Deltaproteobacteria bacterium]
MNLKNFANALAGWQGGIPLKRGQSCILELSGGEVEEIFGEKPAAFAAHGLTITIKPSRKGKYLMTVRRED